jgi:integrase
LPIHCPSIFCYRDSVAGSLRRRGRDSWELRVHAGRDDATGRKLYVTRTVRGGKREADRALARLVTEVEQGSVLAHSGTVAELCERWFEASRTSWSPTVVVGYRSLLDRHILPTFGHVSLRRLRTADLDSWYGRLRSSGGVNGAPLSPNSVQRIHAVLRRALSQGVKWGWLSVNPAASASPPRVLRSSVSIPSPEAVAALIESANKVNPALPVFLRLAAVTGARRGELCAVRWRHVDFESAVLHIEGSLVEVDGTVIEKDTKTHAQRRVSLDERTLDVLRTYRESRESILRVADAHVNPEGFVFSHDPGGAEPWRPNYATLAFGRLADEQGLEGVRLHDLRHFAATTMLVSGIDIRTASGRLGHANASTTLDIYSHFVAAADERAASAVAGVLDR